MPKQCQRNGVSHSTDCLWLYYKKAGLYLEILNQALFSCKQNREMGYLLHILSDKHDAYYITDLDYYIMPCFSVVSL